MNRLKWGWLVTLMLLALPYLALFAAGSIWLYQYRLIWGWIMLTIVTLLVGWPAVSWLRRKSLRRLDDQVPSSPLWPPTGKAAWPDVEAIARRLQDENPPLDRPEPWLKALGEVLRTVASRYHPDARRPEWEIPVPHVLRIVELVASDLREAFSEHVPGAHILTLGDLAKLSRMAAHYRRWYLVYRILMAPVNPLAALLREFRDQTADRMLGRSADDLRRWAIGYCVRRAGHYAIELYSGNLSLRDVEFAAYRCGRSLEDAARAQIQAEQQAAEPLRILVAGQVKAGKSSLINALFGEVRAAVDVVPRTRLVEPFLLERGGIPRAVLLDTAGYEDAQWSNESVAEFERQVLQVDLVLLVCSAASAARAADRRVVDHWRAAFQQAPDRPRPPLLVALTHVDHLRPLDEWSPPYRLDASAVGKAAQIRDAVLTVGQDLGLPTEHVVPVCLAPGRTYNVDESLAAAMVEVLPEAERSRCLRCLKEYRDAQYWRQLWRQAINSGRLLLRLGRE